MSRSDAHPAAHQTRRTVRVWPIFATLVLALAACSPASPASSAPPVGSTAAQPSASVGQSAAASVPESVAPSVAAGGTLTGSWDGTWAIDPPYAGSAGTFSMELVQTGDAFSGTVEITNSDCGNGTVDGTVNGTAVTFGWVTTKQPIQFTGTLNGTSSMNGTWSSVACSDASISLTGTWEATKH